MPPRDESPKVGICKQAQDVVRSIIHDLLGDNDTAMVDTGAVGRMAFNMARDGSIIPLLIEWTSVEQFKQLARQELRGKFGHESESNEVYQGDMFSGYLQLFYPVRSAEGTKESYYKRRELLTDDEVDQNLAALKKQSDARLLHYDALLAYKLGR